MKWTRYEELCSEVYDFIFQLLDNEPEFNGFEAGEIATEIENRFREEVYSFQDVEK